MSEGWQKRRKKRWGLRGGRRRGEDQEEEKEEVEEDQEEEEEEEVKIKRKRKRWKSRGGRRRGEDLEKEEEEEEERIRRKKKRCRMIRRIRTSHDSPPDTTSSLTMLKSFSKCQGAGGTSLRKDQMWGGNCTAASSPAPPPLATHDAMWRESGRRWTSNLGSFRFLEVRIYDTWPTREFFLCYEVISASIIWWNDNCMRSILLGIFLSFQFLEFRIYDTWAVRKKFSLSVLLWK